MNTAEITVLTVMELRNISRQRNFALPRAALASKDHLLSYIEQYASSDDIAAFVDEAEKKRERQSRKRCYIDEDNEHKRVRRQTGEFQPVKPRDHYDGDRYLDVPIIDDVKSCYRSFYERTSNKMVKMAVCGVCARELLVQDENVQVLPLHNIPNHHRLQPHQPHHAHPLVEGKLLASRGLLETGHGTMVNICRQCLASLQSAKEAPPIYSLANNMWIGEIPDLLSSLTFPEQLLLSHFYPRVFVFKLYPKKGFGGDPSKLQKAMRGTVSTFELDMPGITSMVEGNLMPRPPLLLASIISVTYIGLGQLPMHWLRHFFRVRRIKVWLALHWLKKNNPKYYGNIKIDSDRLNSLPEDEVPIELLSII
jgi:hypothetical protein